MFKHGRERVKPVQDRVKTVKYRQARDGHGYERV